MRAGLVLLLLLGGCAELERLSPGECGNGVVDPGEDCDRFAPDGQECGAAVLGAGACRLLCETREQCPAGWGCRQDGLCHHATGAFRPGADVTVPADTFMVADVDGDGMLDVIAQGGAALRVLFGDGEGGFGQTLVRPLPLLTGRPATGDLDGDGLADLALPYREGLALLAGRADRSLDVLPVAAYVVAQDWYVPIQAWGPRGDHQSEEDELFGLEVVTDPAHEPPTRLEPSLITIPLSAPARADMIDIPARADLGSRLAVADDDGDGDEEILVSAGDGELRRCSTDYLFFIPNPREPARLSCGGSRNSSEDFLDRGGLTLTRDALYADADDDGDLDVVVGIEDETHGKGVAVLVGDGAGAYKAASRDEALSSIGMPLAAGDLDGDGMTDWVTPDGIFLGHGSHDPEPVPCGPALPPIRDALVTRLSDPRGLPDVVVALDDEVRVLLNDGVGEACFFTEKRFTTEGRPFSLRAGTFDGDPLGDVVFGEHREDGADALLLLFGQAYTHPTGPIRIAGIPDIERIEVGLIRDNSDLFDGASDITVSSAAGPGGGHPFAFFEGSADRNLNAPLALAIDYRPEIPADVFVGRFLAGRGPGADIAAITRDPPSGRTRLWVAGAEPDSIFRAEQVGVVLVDDVIDDWPALGCEEAPAWAAGDRDGDGVEEMLGLDCQGELRVFRAEPLGAPLRFSSVEASSMMDQPPSVGPFRLELADLDDDGRPELVVIDEEGLRIIRTDTARETTVPARAVARLSADGDSAPELAILSDDGLFVGTLGGDAVRLAESAASTVTGTQVIVADLDGDDLDDVVIGDGAGITVLLADSHLVDASR